MSIAVWLLWPAKQFGFFGFAKSKRNSLASLAPHRGAKQAKSNQIKPLCDEQSMKEQISIYLFSSTLQSSRSLSIVQTLHFAILQQ